MARIDVLYSSLTSCEVFADIGCDHGYVAELVAKNNLANKIYITDISAPSLKKAESLLFKYLGKKVFSVVCDGFSLIPETVDQALIAGMGGEEIIKILSNGQRPNRVVLQPMKNTEKLRKKLIELGYKIIKDYTFIDGKFYDLIIAEKGEDYLSEDEINFGRTNLIERPNAFLQKMQKEHQNITVYLTKDLGEKARTELEERKKLLEKHL